MCYEINNVVYGAALRLRAAGGWMAAPHPHDAEDYERAPPCLHPHLWGTTAAAAQILASDCVRECKQLQKIYLTRTFFL